MKTYPIYKKDGTLIGFEITSAWLFFRPLFKILKSVEGVTDVKRQWHNDDRVAFKYHGYPAVVYEPWGDSSRYWIGLQEPDSQPNIDISPLHQVFKNYTGFTFFYFPVKLTSGSKSN